jgi:S-adenosylmethionine hydrolase
LTPVSHTFQGRDVFAPAAAHLAGGVQPSELGPAVAAQELVRLEVPEAWLHDDHFHAEVLQVDRFGNLQFNLARGELERSMAGALASLEVRMEGHRLHLQLGSTFSDVESGEFVLVEDSYQYISLAVRNGDAARKLQAGAGSTAIIGPARN